MTKFAFTRWSMAIIGLSVLVGCGEPINFESLAPGGYVVMNQSDDASVAQLVVIDKTREKRAVIGKVVEDSRFKAYIFSPYSVGGELAIKTQNCGRLSMTLTKGACFARHV